MSGSAHRSTPPKLSVALIVCVVTLAIVGYVAFLRPSHDPRPTAASTEAPAPALTPDRSSDLKAALLFQMASFAEWPAHAFPSPEAPLTIGVIGANPFGTVLDDIAHDEKAAGHPLRVRRFTQQQAAEAAGSHVLFVCASEASRLTPILRAVRGKPVLTVSDLPNFIEAGGTFIAAVEEGKLRLKYNPLAVRAANLTVSSKILRLADRVEQEVTP